MTGNPKYLFRAYLVQFVAMLLGVAVLAKLISLHGEVEASDNLVDTGAVKTRKVRAVRGNIFSDDRSLMATSLPFYKVAIDPHLPSQKVIDQNLDSLSLLLAAYFGDKSAESYKKGILEERAAGRRYLPLGSREIDFQDRKRMETWPMFREGPLKGGCMFDRRERRYFPLGSLARRTIGDVDEQSRGTLGVEYSFNEMLSGKDGQALYQRIPPNHWRIVYHETNLTPIQGMDIQTTLNVEMQEIVHRNLQKALLRHAADYGVAIVLEVQTGEIKALSNLSRNSRGVYRERYNYAVASQGVREPGSTFKLIPMMAMLEYTEATLEDTIETGEGNYQFFDKVMRDHKEGGFGKITLREAFEKSSNIGIARATVQHFGSHPQTLVRFVRSLGLHEPMGFQIKGEGVPYIKSPQDKNWTGTTLPWMSLGYELKVSPLQMVTLYNAVANDGIMVQPRIVKEIMQEGRVAKKCPARIINPKICSPQTLQKIRSLLEGVVERGTARRIRSTNPPLAGKTGTAKDVVDGAYTNKYYTSFAGYFPAKSPRYTCIVVINNPRSGQIYGSDVAAPVFRDIAQEIHYWDMSRNLLSIAARGDTETFPFIRSGNQKDLSYLVETLQVAPKHQRVKGDWVHTRVSHDRIVWDTNPVKGDRIPNLKAMTGKDAVFLLESRGMKAILNGFGRVLRQSLPAGTKARPGQIITLNLE